MEQYFRAARIPDSKRVSITNMYLQGDAKLWCSTRMEDDANAGQPTIKTWEVLKKELKDQFLPCNTTWVARESLKKLKHMGTVRDYVKEFSSLLLNIKNMSEEDKLFNFLSGLQPWAQLELRMQEFKGLLYVKAFFNGKEVKAMVDSGATNNFVAHREVERLDLEIFQSTTKLKAMNSKVKSIQGAATIKLKAGTWESECNLMVVPLDDFDLILGIEFLSAAKAMLAPHLRGMMICDEGSPCFFEEISVNQSKVKGVELQLAKQFKYGMKRGNEAYVTALIEIKPDQAVEVPDYLAEVLGEFAHMMPPEFPKELPPRRAIDHKIELEPEPRPSAKAPYRMGPAKLANLPRQLDELLDAGLIQPSKAPYGAPVLF
ncbi:uncharacterized protein LOC133779926 [Humulus lupulus]|uniref:uncharacterized protein LOC133779926 n=1 Tax=Humulus lupulus TaxID=3486 RepID=UPI002B41005C|nr:uncharacterized protein LOC133779926 [Humulus lupulus]